MDFTSQIGIGGVGWDTAFPTAIILALVWNAFWKGFALWYAAKRGEKWWFIAFLFLGTAGILEIVYLFFIAKIPEFRKRLGM